MSQSNFIDLEHSDNVSDHNITQDQDSEPFEIQIREDEPQQEPHVYPGFTQMSDQSNLGFGISDKDESEEKDNSENFDSNSGFQYSKFDQDQYYEHPHDMSQKS